MTMTGTCLCGQVTYEVASEPLATAICHCRHCQRQSGSAFSLIVAVPTGAVTVTGEPKTFADTADSGAAVDRKFCPECGSPIFTVVVATPELTFIKAGTLDDVSALAPQFEVWCQSAQPWVPDHAGLPRFEGNPPPAA